MNKALIFAVFLQQGSPANGIMERTIIKPSLRAGSRRQRFVSGMRCLFSSKEALRITLLKEISN